MDETALVSSALITLEVLLRPAVDGLAELAKQCDFYESLKSPFLLRSIAARHQRCNLIGAGHPTADRLAVTRSSGPIRSGTLATIVSSLRDRS